MTEIKDKWQTKKIEKGRSWEKKKILSGAKPAVNIKRGDMVKGRVYNVIEDGAFIVTPENYIGFIHNDETPQSLKVDTQVEARVTYVREDGKLNLSLKPPKEVGRLHDAERIMEYLKKRKGAMPYSDQTPPDVIKDVFGISKAAFKRALGKLMKDGLVEQKDNWVSLKGIEED